jgi:type I restriction enzyme R subunit
VARDQPKRARTPLGAGELFVSVPPSEATLAQVRFVDAIVDELTANGVGPGRLFESPCTDHGQVDVVFRNDLAGIVDLLREVNRTAIAGTVA